MKLPNGKKASVSDEKLLRYLLNPQHPVGGRHEKGEEIPAAWMSGVSQKLRIASRFRGKSKRRTGGSTSLSMSFTA
jgi:hypothetical protein